MRLPGNRFAVFASPPILADRTKDAEADIRNTTQRVVDIFQEFVRRYPDQWYVFRDMWPNDERGRMNSIGVREAFLGGLGALSVGALAYGAAAGNVWGSWREPTPRR